jgi:transposase
MFSYVDTESRIPKSYPIRKIRRIVNKALEDLESTFDEMYDSQGRPSIPPEQLLRALLLQILFTIRSERQLMERIGYDLLFRWFVGLGIDDPVWNHSTFSKNCERLLSVNIDELFFEAIKHQAASRQLLSREHFIVDGTLPRCWRSAWPHRHTLGKPIHDVKGFTNAACAWMHRSGRC